VSHPEHVDALVIGGGFYGCSVALHLSRTLGLRRVVLAEIGGALMRRASHANQARIHQGHHYPRDFTTAFRSRASFRRFVERYPGCVHDRYRAVYAVAARNSHVTATQFSRMMAEVGAPCRPAPREVAALFSRSLVEAVFEVEEFAFDSGRLAACVEAELRDAGVDVRLGQEAVLCVPGNRATEVRLSGGAALSCGRVVNCTYGRLAHVPGLPPPKARLRHEICEIALVEPPPALAGVGVTVMDGPFFSCMPFPSRGLHSLTHVRYTPHLAWLEGDGTPDPYGELESFAKRSSIDLMLRDASRYLPALAGARHVESLWEVKTVLLANEANDGRPILLEGSVAPGGVAHILGGKIDNIFDVLEALPAAGGE